MSWLSRTVRPDLGRLFAAAVVGSAAHLSAIALAGTAAWLLARALHQPPPAYIAVALVTVRAFGVGRGALRYAERLVGHDAADWVMARSRVQMYADLERSGPVHASRLRSGDVLARIIDDVHAVHDLLVRGLLPIAVAAVTGTVAVVTFSLIHRPAGGVLLFGLLLGGLLAPRLTVKGLRRAERRLAKARDDLASSATELFTGATDLQAARATGRWLGRINSADDRLTKITDRTASAAGLGAALSGLALGLTVVLELVVGITAAGSGQLSALWLPVLALAPFAVFEVAGKLPGAAWPIARGAEAATRLRALSELPQPPGAAGTMPLPDGPLRLEVTELAVRWPGAADLALQDVSLNLRPGRRIGVVGESGAGKTTLVTALLRFLPAEAGSIRISGQELSDIEEGSLRSAVAVCSQDTHLFDTSIRNNLSLARPDATLHEMAEALRKARVWDWVQTLPLGLDTPVGDRGIRLSGGERQRLALARALLADPPVLLLDEPTAYLDEPTAAALMRDLLVATVGRTTLLVTHRLAGLSVVDEIIVLAGGRVVQRGTPTELMEGPGPYRKMWFRSAASASSLSGLAPSAG